MSNYFKNIIASAYDRDPGFIRLMKIVLAVAAVILAILSVFVFTIRSGPAIKLVAAVTLALAIMAGVAFFLTYRQILWPGKILVPLAALVGVVFMTAAGNGLHDPAIVGFSAVIVVTSLLAGQRAIPLVTFLTLIGIWIVAASDLTGVTKSDMAKVTGIDTIAVISLTQVIIGASLNGLMVRLNAILAASRANEKAQIQANQELRDLQAGLEQRIAERTQSLELAAEVGHSISQVRALGVMLTDAVELIRSRFDLYYAQVYLTNPTQTELLLHAGTGPVGEELLRRHHSLPLDTASINGRAAFEKRPVVIPDTLSSASFRPNPLLPDTRSEMAIPLLVGEKVVGVLNMQSRQAGALSEEALPAFETLAGQLAIAIQNANLLAETQEAREEVEKQARRLVRTNWVDYLDAIHKPEHTGFMFEQNQIKPLDTVNEAPAENAINAPIAVTGEAIGSLVVELEAEKQTAQNMELINTVARQVAQQIESLRLLEDAERYRAEAEAASRRLTLEGWKSYTEEKGGKLGYLYDLKEVLPVEPERKAGDNAVTLPIKVREEEVGRLALMGVDQHDGQSLELANAVAERLGAHIESLRQQDQTQSALAQSEKLFEASRALTQAQDLQQLVKTVAETMNIPVVNRAVLDVFTYNAAGELEGMDVAATWWSGSGHEPTAIGTHYSKEMLRVMSLFLTTTPLFFSNAEADERFDPGSLQIAKGLNVLSGALLPLHAGERQIGVLMLQAEEPYPFTHAEIRLFEALAPQIATVLENRRQFERAQKQAERESTLNVISQKIQSATTVEAVLQIAARELGHALGAPLTIAQLGLQDEK